MNRPDELHLETTVSVDRNARVHIPLTALGALLGGVIAVIATGVILEGVVVLAGAVAGWVLGLVIALGLDIRRKRRTPPEQLSYDELYARAQDLEVDGRSDMSRSELVEAVSRTQD